MNPTSVLESIGAVSVGIAAVCGLVFIVVYAIYAPWRNSMIGRHMMLLCGCLVLLMCISVTIRIFPFLQDYARIVGSVVMTFTGLLFLRQARFVYKTQKRRKTSGNTPVG